MTLAESESVPLRGVEDVEREGSGKKVVAASVRLEERYGPTPARRVVRIETRDGAVYRFQRYSRREHLAFESRENPDGSEFARRSKLPAHVQAVREAIMAGDVLPDVAALVAAERKVGERDAPDDAGGVEDDREALRREGRRREEALLRSGYALTDGGNSHADRVAEQLSMAEEYLSTDDGGDDE